MQLGYLHISKVSARAAMKYSARFNETDALARSLHLFVKYPRRPRVPTASVPDGHLPDLEARCAPQAVPSHPATTRYCPDTHALTTQLHGRAVTERVCRRESRTVHCVDRKVPPPQHLCCVQADVQCLIGLCVSQLIAVQKYQISFISVAKGNEFFKPCVELSSVSILL